MPNPNPPPLAPGPRPLLRLRVRRPTLERATLKELQGMLIDRLGELELLEREAWGPRRN
jgi:hypothetical protein